MILTPLVVLHAIQVKLHNVDPSLVDYLRLRRIALNG